MDGTGETVESLLVLAKAGHAGSLGQLLQRYRNYLELLARIQIGRRLQSKVDATDLVQETFLDAHASFAQFRGATEPELVAWLRQVLAYNLASLVRHYHGAQRRDVDLERQLSQELDQSSQAMNAAFIAPTSSPSQQAARREQAVILADALGRLPAEYREVVILRQLQGLSFPEVAKQMNRSLDSVKKLFVRGLARLRGALGDKHEPA
jgi:RNA polymerase sigma-70 factor (ECF subfamily)